jgi:hypothetical protein
MAGLRRLSLWGALGLKRSCSFTLKTRCQCAGSVAAKLKIL